jgi:hypothetical protein
LIALLLSLLRGSYQKELDRFFHILGRSDAPSRVVTKASLAKARMKLNYQAFINSITDSQHALNITSP